jgi:molybdate transport system regulatory protein
VSKPADRKIKVGLKLWFSSARDEGIMGDGKWRLLKAVGEHGSLLAASRALGMSYRKTWGDLGKAERCLGIQLVEKRRGGADGGGAALTPAGRRCIRAYDAYRAEVEAAAHRAYERHMAHLLEKSDA